MVAPMIQWVIYDHPLDMPEHFVARKWVVLPGSFGPTDEVIKATDLEELREQMEAKGLTCLARSPQDEPQIVEIWL